MGSVTDANIKAFQERTGIEPDNDPILEEMSKRAYELIRAIELEISGIRDGDGVWHGSYPVASLVGELVELINKRRLDI